MAIKRLDPVDITSPVGVFADFDGDPRRMLGPHIEVPILSTGCINLGLNLNGI